MQEKNIRKKKSKEIVTVFVFPKEKNKESIEYNQILIDIISDRIKGEYDEQN